MKHGIRIQYAGISLSPQLYMGVSNTLLKLGRVHYGMDPIGLRIGRVRTQDHTYQVSRISWETPAFWIHLPLTCRVTKIFRISSTKFGQLILSKITNIVATRCHILRLKWWSTKFHFGCGSAPDAAGGAHVQHSPGPLSWI